MEEGEKGYCLKIQRNGRLNFDSIVIESYSKKSLLSIEIRENQSFFAILLKNYSW